MAKTRAARFARVSRPLLSSGGDVQPIHLHDVQAVRGSTRRTRRCSRTSPCRFFPGRQDRRARPQRRGQVDPAADHGRAGHRVPRRGAARARRDGRPARAGARSSTRPRTCAATSRRAWPSCAALLDRFNELAVNYSDETADEFARLQEQIDAADAWNLDTMLDTAMDALRLPPLRRRRHEALRRRAPPRGAVPAAALASPTCCCSTSPPTTSTPSRWPGSSATSRTTRAPSSPSPTIATSSTTSPAGSSSSTAAAASPSRATTRAGSSRSRRAWRRRRSRRARASARSPQELEWVRQNPKGRRKKSKARLNNYEALLAEERNVKLDQVQIHIPPGPRLGDVVIEADGLRKGFGDRLLIEDLSFSLPPAGIVGVIGPNGAGKTTLFRMIVGQEKPDAGDAARRRHRRARLRRPVARRARPGQDRLGGDLRAATSTSRSATREVNSRPYVADFNFKGSDQQKKVGEALRRRAQPPAPGQAAALRRQPAAARRADQRPRRRHPARARGGAARASPAAR